MIAVVPLGIFLFCLDVAGMGSQRFEAIHGFPIVGGIGTFAIIRGSLFDADKAGRGFGHCIDDGIEFVELSVVGPGLPNKCSTEHGLMNEGGEGK